MAPAETVTNQNALPRHLSGRRSASTFAAIAVASVAAAAIPIGALAEGESISSDESFNASVQQYRVPASERGTWHNPYVPEARALAAGERTPNAASDSLVEVHSGEGVTTVEAVAAASRGAAVPASTTDRRCSTLTDRDRAVVARLPRDLVEDVTALVEDAPAQIPASWTAERRRVLTGATVAVRPVPGLSVERLQRLVACGLAAAVIPGASDWIPLPAGVVPSVRSGRDRFLVDLRATDERDARETLAALQRLAPPR
ncbi:MAG: hypothetical protein ACJ79Y_02205 [Myxococcales bacterium]